MSRRTKWLLAAVLLTAAMAIVLPQTSEFRRLMLQIEVKKTVAQRLEQYGPAARERLKAAFAARGVAYPPRKVVLVALKQERQMHVYARAERTSLKYVMSYPILGASGHLGPKLREGDLQVPEGVYKVVFLNANSLYHLSLRLDYPNEFDRAMASRDHRQELGGDIMIHGYKCSIGCLAMGNPASEDLFVLAADVGMQNVKVILSPVDFRTSRCSRARLPGWTDQLYRVLAAELARLPAPH